jgi:hypothetical protein
MTSKLSQIKNKVGTCLGLGSAPMGRQTAVVKRFGFVLLVLLPLSACGPKHASGAKAPAARAASSAQPAAPQGPAAPLPGLAVVRDLYKPGTAPIPDAPGKDPFFTPDLARALKAHSYPGRPGAIDFDYRYGAQTLEVSEVTVTAANTLDGERVAARFDNIGKAYEIDYDLLETRDGWRIADVSAPAQQGDGPWDLRQMFKLPAADTAPTARP